MKGFFSFAIFFTLAGILLFFAAENENDFYKLSEIKNELIISEISNMERTLLENNTDKIIQLKLNEQIGKNNFKITSVQTEINSKLANHFSEKVRAATIFGEDKGIANEQFLKDNTSVTILQGEEFVYGEYVFTSNSSKNTIVKGKLGNKINSYFTIPIGYTIHYIGGEI